MAHLLAKGLPRRIYIQEQTSFYSSKYRENIHKCSDSTSNWFVWFWKVVFTSIQWSAPTFIPRWNVQFLFDSNFISLWWIFMLIFIQASRLHIFFLAIFSSVDWFSYINLLFAIKIYRIHVSLGFYRRLNIYSIYFFSSFVSTI